MKIHYKIFKLLKELLKKEGYELSVKDLQQLILRYILNKNIDINVKSKEDDSVYIKENSEIANKQLLEDIKYYRMKSKMYDLIKELLDSSFLYAHMVLKELDKIIEDSEINVIINEKNSIPLLVYESKSLERITDNNIKIYNNKIEMIYLSKNNNNLKDKNVFCALLRYKYLYLDAHGSQLEYKNSITNFSTLDLNEATECFASPFNHIFNNYCSAFEDLEKPLGSLGNFFKIKKFPTKILLINPVFDKIFINLTIDYILKYLEKNKHIVYFILPSWKKILSYEKLYSSKYFIKNKIFPKGELYFYNFPTGRYYSPCDIEIIQLKS